jgi:hypothetical protein
MSDGDAFAVARVIAALDASCHDISLLPAAVDLAARLGAEVTGLFIEDENLLRLSTLPAARHVALGSSRQSMPSLEQIEAELRALAAQAAAELGRAAARQGVPWSFRIVRGQPDEELHESTLVRDLIVVGRARSLAGVPLQLASALQDAIGELPHSTLHLSRRTTLARPIAVLHAGSKLIDRTLTAALRLAGPKATEIDVLLTGPDAAPMKAQIERRLAPLGIRALTRLVVGAGQDALARALAETDGDILVAAADVPVFGRPEDLPAFLDRTGLPVMIVRD